MDIQALIPVPDPKDNTYKYQGHVRGRVIVSTASDWGDVYTIGKVVGCERYHGGDEIHSGDRLFFLVDKYDRADLYEEVQGPVDYIKTERKFASPQDDWDGWIEHHNFMIKKANK